MNNQKGFLLLLSIISLLSLIAAYRYPFMYSEFMLEFPGWFPEFFADRTRNWIIYKGRIPTGSHYLWGMISNLFLARELFIGTIIAIFSAGFPAIKIATIIFLTLSDNGNVTIFRQRLMKALNLVSKWSMADVFIVGMLIVFMKAEGFHFRFTAGIGLYFFAVAAFLSTISLQLLMRLNNTLRFNEEP